MQEAGSAREIWYCCMFCDKPEGAWKIACPNWQPVTGSLSITLTNLFSSCKIVPKILQIKTLGVLLVYQLLCESVALWVCVGGLELLPGHNYPLMETVASLPLKHQDRSDPQSHRSKAVTQLKKFLCCHRKSQQYRGSLTLQTVNVQF